jgi:hypothetical protein
VSRTSPEPVKPRFALRALTEPGPAQNFLIFRHEGTNKAGVSNQAVKIACAPFFDRPQWTGKDTNPNGSQIAETSLDRNRLARIRYGQSSAASIGF